MTVKRRDFQKAAALVHEFLLKLTEDPECAELRDALNLALLHMQRYYRLLRNRMNQDKATNGSILTQSLRGLSPMTPFKDAPDKFQWKWLNLDNPKLRGTLPLELSTEFSTLPEIIRASKVGDNNRIMQLVDHDPDNVLELDGIGRNSLMYAVHFGQLDTVQILLEQGIDVNTTAHDGSTAAHRACHDGNDEALQILIGYEADLTHADNHGRSPIHWACANDNRECLRLLIDQGASVNARDKEGMSPSMWACRVDHIEHFELLSRVENQDIPEDDGLERDSNGKTWMHHSVRRTEPLECLRTLLTEESASIQDDDGRTVLHTAADHGSLASCKVILEIAGKDCLNQRDNVNRTPLILSAMGGHGEVLNFLLSQGADIAMVDNFGATSWDYARNRQLHYCMLILASYIRQQAKTSVSGSGEEGDMPGEGGLGVSFDTLNINPDSSMYNYGNKPVAAPHPPMEPPGTPRSARGNSTPRSSRPKTPATPRSSQNGPIPSPRGQHPVTTADQHRGGGKKRSPTTPVEDEDGGMLFQRHEREGSAGSKRMRSEDEHSPERDRDMRVSSVMSVESLDHGGESPSHHSSQQRAHHNNHEAEMNNESEYIAGEDEERTVSIEAMDVSDFDQDLVDEEASGGEESQPPPPQPRPQKRAPPPAQFHHPHPPAQSQPYHAAPPPASRDPPGEQQYHEYVEGPDDGGNEGGSEDEGGYSPPPPQPTPRSPERSPQNAPFSAAQPGKKLPPLGGSLSPPPLSSPLSPPPSMQGLGAKDRKSAFTPPTVKQGLKTRKSGSPKHEPLVPLGNKSAGAQSPGSLGLGNHGNPGIAGNQERLGSASANPRATPTSLEPLGNTSTTPSRLEPLRPLSASSNSLAPLASAGRVIPPAHLTPLQTPTQVKKKKKKKKRDRPDSGGQQEYLQPAPPPRGYASPTSPSAQGQLPPTPQKREKSPPRPLPKGPPHGGAGYQGGYSQQQGGYSQRNNPQGLKTPPVKRGQQEHEQKSSRFPKKDKEIKLDSSSLCYALDQQLKVNTPSSAGSGAVSGGNKPPPSPRGTSTLPHASPRSKLPPSPGARLPSDSGFHGDSRSSQEYDDGVDKPARGGQGNKNQRFPGAAVNGGLQNGGMQRNLPQPNGPYMKRQPQASGGMNRKPPPSPTGGEQHPPSPKGRRPGSGSGKKIPPTPWSQQRPTSNGRLPPSVNH